MAFNPPLPNKTRKDILEWNLFGGYPFGSIWNMFLLPIGRNIFSWVVSELQPVDPTNRKAINLGAFLGEVLGTLCKN